MIVGEADWEEVKEFLDLHRIARERAEELGISRDVIDETAGLTARYAVKLLSPKPTKHFGKISLLKVFRALGLRLIVVRDADAAAEIKRSVPPRTEYNVRHREIAA